MAKVQPGKDGDEVEDLINEMQKEGLDVSALIQKVVPVVAPSKNIDEFQTINWALHCKRGSSLVERVEEAAYAFKRHKEVKEEFQFLRNQLLAELEEEEEQTNQWEELMYAIDASIKYNQKRRKLNAEYSENVDDETKKQIERELRSCRMDPLSQRIQKARRAVQKHYTGSKKRRAILNKLDYFITLVNERAGGVDQEVGQEGGEVGE
jgi:hypothetical protein